MSWRLSVFISHDSFDGEGKGGFAGTSASMCSAKGTVIQGLQICSEFCVSGVEN